MKHAVIQSTGRYLPEKTVSNVALETMVDTTHEWIYTRTGIRSRHIASKHETTAFMASRAALQALKRANLPPDAIDLVLVATCTPHMFFPSVACHVLHALKIPKHIPAFDLGAACSGFLYAMDVAWQYIKNGSARNVLVIGSETMSWGLDWQDRSTCVLFGDGAGAVLLSASDKPGILSSVLHAAFDENSSLAYVNGNLLKQQTFIQMKGNEVFRQAVSMMSEVVDEVLVKANLNPQSIDWLVPHQANIRIIQSVAKKLGLPMEKVIVALETQGNTSAASIPLALDEGIVTARIQPNELVLMESFGAGMTWGAMLIRMGRMEFCQ